MSRQPKVRERELLRVELPYTATVPRLLNPELGLRNVIARSGPDSGYELVITLLDTPDHRLLRSGLMLAHRVLRERGEWVLRMPDWTPGPPEVIIPMAADGDLPALIIDLLAPFRRLGTLGAVAAMTAERRDYLMRDGEGGTLARIRDEKVTLRRGGLTTARFHEVTVTADPRRLGAPQQQWIAEALVGAGATRLDRFPTIQQRLGAPATGPGDFPDPEQIETATVAGFVRALLARRIRELIRADLATSPTPAEDAVVGERADGGGGLAPAAVVAPGRPGVADLARGLRRELLALAPLLDPDWLSGVDDDLEWLGRQPLPGPAAGPTTGRTTGPATDPTTDPVSRAGLRGERYLALLELLVSAVRTPRIGEAVFDESRPVLDQLLERQLDELITAASGLAADEPDTVWSAVRDETDRAVALGEVCGGRVRGRLRRRARHLPELESALTRTVDDDRELLRERAAGRPESAFDLGREYERRTRTVRSARRRFVRDWPDLAAKLR